MGELIGSEEKFYVAVLVWESSSVAPGYQPLYEESFMLLRAASLDEAKTRAEELGRAEQSQYVNENGETITWLFKHLIDVNDVLWDDLADNTTLYSRHFRDYDAYRRFEPLLSGVTDPDP
jgi:hypothetical protein